MSADEEHESCEHCPACYHLNDAHVMDGMGWPVCPPVCSACPNHRHTEIIIGTAHLSLPPSPDGKSFALNITRHPQ